MRSSAWWAAVLLAGGCASAPVQAAPPPQAEVTLDVFEGPLAEYGQWVVIPRYGRAWRPLHVAAGWQPYLHGEWVWTDDGWYWVTDEPWGWATYHYGRWAFDPELGWVWVPGYAWGPAWVAWRVVDGYVGWAPLYPGIDVWWTDAYPLDPPHWIFVPTRSFVGVRIDVVAVPRPRILELVRSSRPAPPPIRGRSSAAPPRGGPSRPAVERAVGRPVRPARIVAVPTPAETRRGVERGAVPVYRPPAPAARPRPPAAGTRARPAPAPAPERERAPATRSAPARRPAETAPAPAPRPAPQPKDRQEEGARPERERPARDR